MLCCFLGLSKDALGKVTLRNFMEEYERVLPLFYCKIRRSSEELYVAMPPVAKKGDMIIG